MKSKILLLLMILAAAGFRAPAAADSEPSRKLTLMVYMCGSNLESEYGSASADIREMMEASFSPEEMSLLVMAGGTTRWEMGYSPEESSILEIRSGRQRAVWHGPLRNMGREGTLRFLMSYAREHYPAERYALILWDHGGGPLEGLCWDELFSMDRLTLTELTDGLNDAMRSLWLATGEEKLAWIGFDACLMGTAEVADAVAPYAEYMIASQETEPADGWDYGFLSKMDPGASGAETGRLIVDSYFECRPESRDRLTLACIDLGAMEALQTEMDAFFEQEAELVDEQHFAALSGLRQASSGFGQTVRAAGSDGYDLVDLGDLAERYGPEAEKVRSALERAVVYSRCSETRAAGLSVYHPFNNKARYLEAWRTDYRRLGFSDGYARYMERFGTLLTGETPVSWFPLTPREETGENAGVFALELTEEQRADLASAQLLILARQMGTALSPIYAVQAAEEDGTLRAAYGGRALYAVDGDGNRLLGPISFLRQEDGKTLQVLTTYSDYSGRHQGAEEQAVLYECEADEETGEVRILRTYVFDRATESYTNRAAFSEEGYTSLFFHEFLRTWPEDREPIPGFQDWKHYNGYLARSISLPQEWHLAFAEAPHGEKLFGVFQVTDSRRNTWSSELFPLRNEAISEAGVTVRGAEEEDVGFRFRLEMKRAELKPCADIYMEAENRSGLIMDIRGTGIIVNGTRETEASFLLTDLGPGETGEHSQRLEALSLTGLEEIRSLDFTLEITRRAGEEDEGETRETQMHLDVTDGSLEGIAKIPPEPLAETESQGLLWQLVSLNRESDGSFQGVIHAQNPGEEDWDGYGQVFLNRVRAEGFVSVSLGGGRDGYFRLQAENAAHVSQFDLPVESTPAFYLLSVPEALEQAGVTEISEAELYFGGDEMDGTAGAPVTLRLKNPIPIGPGEAAPARKPLLIPAEDGGDRPGVSVLLESAFAGDDGVGLGLRLRNDSEEKVTVAFTAPEMNGTELDEFESYDRIGLPAGSMAVKTLVLRNWELTGKKTPLEKLCFRIRAGKLISDPVELAFPEGTRLGAEGGILLTAEEIQVRPAALTEQAETEEESEDDLWSFEFEWEDEETEETLSDLLPEA